MPQNAQQTICPFCSLGCGLLIDARGADVQVAGDPAHPINRGAICARGALLARSRNSPLRATSVRYRPAGSSSWQPQSWDWAVDRIARWLSESQALPDHRRPIVFGGAALDCEDIQALARLAARLSLPHGLGAASVAATAETVRQTYGVATFDFAPDDFLRSRTIVVWGANPAENHPIAMRWLLAARERGTRLVVVDPRLTRTAAAADLHVSLCPGTDLALIEALLAEAIARNVVDRDFPAARDGEAQLPPESRPSIAEHSAASNHRAADSRQPLDAAQQPAGDQFPDDDRSLWQRLAAAIGQSPATDGPAQFAHRHCGVSTGRFAALCDAIFSAPKRPVAVVLGQGLAQQRLGRSATRALAVLHALGRHAATPGGGLHVFGSDANVRGAWQLAGGTTDSNRPWASDIAGRDGAIFVGENPAVCTPATHRLFESFDRLRWCVVADLWESETAAFWRRPGVDPATIETEVLLLPLPHALELAGTSINAAGTRQHRRAVFPPTGAAKAVRDFADRIIASLPADKGDAARTADDQRATAPTTTQAADPPDASSARDDIPHTPPVPKPSLRISLCSPDEGDVWLPLWSKLPAEQRAVDGSLPAKASADGQPAASSPNSPTKAALPDVPTDRPVAAVLAGVVRLGEHSLQSVFTRAMPWLIEMAPGPFVELSPAVAAKIGVRQGEMVRVFSSTGSIDLPAMVTRRVPAIETAEGAREQIATVGLFGHCGLAAGPTASSLAPPSVGPHHCDVQKAFAAWVCRSDAPRPPNPLS